MRVSSARPVDPDIDVVRHVRVIVERSGLWIEWVNDTLKGQLDFERHGGRTARGIHARIVQRQLAMAVCIWRNWTTAEPVMRSLTAYDHLIQFCLVV